jgi:hypothetical protein
MSHSLKYVLVRYIDLVQYSFKVECISLKDGLSFESIVEWLLMIFLKSDSINSIILCSFSLLCIVDQSTYSCCHIQL